jgi:hypothetical protein
MPELGNNRRSIFHSYVLQISHKNKQNKFTDYPREQSPYSEDRIWLSSKDFFPELKEPIVSLSRSQEAARDL